MLVALAPHSKMRVHVKRTEEWTRRFCCCSGCYSKAVACGAHDTCRVMSRTVSVGYIAGSTAMTATDDLVKAFTDEAVFA